jgi:hypothetical protein
MTIKRMLRKSVRLSVRSDLVWGLLYRTIVQLGEVAKSERSRFDAERRGPTERDRLIADAIATVCPDLTVRHGPFQGMRYPAAVTEGGVLFPKLLGCYETEIHSFLECICERRYEQVIDVGCAVGLAMRLPSARVFAYDTNPEALPRLREMALLNGVEDRIVTGSFCDEATLLNLRSTGRSLIMSDCEGYEMTLLTERVASNLAGHDFLVEVHNFVDVTITATLRRRFAATHDIAVVKSLDDIDKAYCYRYPELDRYDLASRRVLLGECRPTVMEWLFLTSRVSPGT